MIRSSLLLAVLIGVIASIATALNRPGFSRDLVT
jgi:hypothetical protein